MDYSIYFESAPAGEKPLNKYQYDGKFHICKWADWILFEDYSRDDLGNWIPRADNKIQFVNDFLDYHFSKFTGEPRQFFFFLETIMTYSRMSPEGEKLYRPIIEEWIEKAKQRNKSNDTIINRAYLEFIFMKYKGCFTGEELNTWLARFVIGERPMQPINVEKEARPGTSRLKLIAILASIQNATGNAFDFESFVQMNFGLSSFESSKSRNKEKKEYQETFKDCQKIIQK